ncbi:MAG: DUF4397 domain-containing protein [Bacteroidetes bacterium]|nr:DUF4397 domain-containing protein [Bacteroidota bacterium]MBS1973087.1 DUF4397 domain-containing protein [Bacteroidota bacterium]
MVSLCYFILSCKKEQHAGTKITQPSYSLISITNAAVRTDSFEFYIDDSLVALPSSLFFGNTEFFSLQNPGHTDKTPYMNILSGYRELCFKKNGGNNFQIHFNEYFEPGLRYSIFIADTVTHGQLKYLLLKDNIARPDSGKAQLRFINLSPDAPPMDIWVFPNAGNVGYKLFTNRSYAVSNYTESIKSQIFTTIDAGPYYFVATQAGTYNIIMEGGLILAGRGVITIYAKGLLATTGLEQLDVGLIEYTQ